MWKSWVSELNLEKKSLLTTLENEKILQEGIFIDEDNKLTYYLIESDNLKESINIFNSSLILIDIKHKEIVKKSLEFFNYFSADLFLNTK